MIFKVIALYITANSKKNLSNLEVYSKTVIICERNAHLRPWEYIHLNAAGLEFEDLLNFSSFELITRSEGSPTYIHYNSSGSSPYLLCVSSDNCVFTERSITVDPGHSLD
ncbi:uncharacterized protein CDAR_412281 [Caerostris darwini]|uniref:Uncharacterized protein n=1 Tax=Caerostris darwini TaxID=1538125 RepID=A0AAV4NS33_9ARAC|nr:uncharacterized protein CDAR_412281 [Caerostris darwini]